MVSCNRTKKTDYRRLFYRRIGRKGSGSREAFVRACERLGKLDFADMVIEGSISKVLRRNEFSSMHPNAVFGTIQALAVRWGIQPWFAPTRAVAEEITACLLHKAYQLITLEKKGLPRRFVEGDI
jgi:hypothetical protein